MKTIRNILYATLAIILMISTVACTTNTVSKPPENALEEITVILDYLPNTNHTGIYVADVLGYFAEEGLSVSIVEPAENSVTSLISAGKGEFGISYQEDVTYAHTTENPLPIRAIATIIQHNTSGFASHQDKNIIRPKDFEGKTYSGWGTPAEAAVLSAVMRADGGDFNQLTMISSTSAGFAALENRIDLMWFFWAWDGITAQRAGMPLNYIPLAEFDPRLDYYTPVIIASNTLLEDNPAMAKRFLSAVRKGYLYSIAHPEEAAEILQKEIPEYDLDMLIESQKYLADKYIDDAVDWGIMKEEVWAGYMDFMLEYDLISSKVDPNLLFTNAFLPAVAE